MSSSVFTIEAHPSDASLVLYRHAVDGAQQWVAELPAGDFRSHLNQAFPATDLRDGSTVTWAPSPAQVAAANGDALRVKLARALQTNADFLALAPPTNAQVVAQVKALTRECNGIIRELTDALADVSDV